MRLGDIYTPVKFQFARKNFNNFPISILDIGCGNHSPSLTKRWFPKSTYHGVDIQEYRLNNSDHYAMDRFYLVGPDGVSGYDVIPDEFYDFIIMNHVIEHIRDQSNAIRTACKKLKPGGIIWIAFPSPSSLNFPSAVGTLNFCDDPSHVRVCDVMGISNMLLDNNVSIIRGGKSRDFVRFIAGLIVFPLAIWTKLSTGKIQVHGLWYLFGFEDRVIGRKLHTKTR
jgi:SAM-dependent methyltransferase